MTLISRKLLLLGLICGILILANLLWITGLLDQYSVISIAQEVRKEFLTGTAVTIIIVLLILLVAPNTGINSRNCPVCERKLSKGVKYCSDCGSRLESDINKI